MKPSLAFATPVLAALAVVPGLMAQSPNPQLLKDINAQSAPNPSSDPRDIVRAGAFLFFSAKFGPDENDSGQPAAAGRPGSAHVGCGRRRDAPPGSCRLVAERALSSPAAPWPRLSSSLVVLASCSGP